MMKPQSALGETLAKFTKEGELYEKLSENRVRCFACGHRCLIFDGLRGICNVRFNRGGTLLVPHGYIGALQLDPIEKKPFFHALPGAKALSFGMLGCDFHCGYCQNWVTSQALRDPVSDETAKPMPITPQAFVDLAIEKGARVVTSTYNEPLITSEWAIEIFKEAKSRGLMTSYVSNGNGTEEVIDYIKPFVDLYKVDLKGFQDRNYRKLGGTLENTLKTIRSLIEKKFWVEIVTLIIPGFNDSADELRGIARFLKNISPDIPWHVTAFHPDYKMMDRDGTAAEKLLEAAQIGFEEGLRFVYPGNLPGEVGEHESTYCPSCKTILVKRLGYHIEKNNIKDGCCPKCKKAIPGVWPTREGIVTNPVEISA